jgi:hypothetical protein
VCTLAQTAGRCRVDLLEAIAKLGGPAAVAERLCWALRRQTRRPRGYWRNLDNIRTELDQVAFEHSLAHGVIPTKARMRALNRYDVVKAMEAMGGMLAVRTSRMTGGCCGTLRLRWHVARFISCADAAFVRTLWSSEQHLTVLSALSDQRRPCCTHDSQATPPFAAIVQHKAHEVDMALSQR